MLLLLNFYFFSADQSVFPFMPQNLFCFLRTSRRRHITNQGDAEIYFVHVLSAGAAAARGFKTTLMHYVARGERVFHFFTNLRRLFIENSFDARARVGEHFIGNCIYHRRHFLNGQFLSKNNYFIAFGAGNVGYVHHGHVHAHIARYGSSFSVNQNTAASSSEGAGKSVGVTNGNGGNGAVAVHLAVSSVANALPLFYFFNL